MEPLVSEHPEVGSGWMEIELVNETSKLSKKLMDVITGNLFFFSSFAVILKIIH